MWAPFVRLMVTEQDDPNGGREHSCQPACTVAQRWHDPVRIRFITLFRVVEQTLLSKKAVKGLATAGACGMTRRFDLRGPARAKSAMRSKFRESCRGRRFCDRSRMSVRLPL